MRFETEYNSSFKAFDPVTYKSPLISALVDEPQSNTLTKTKPPAGLKSNKFLRSIEPPLQSKSKALLSKDKESRDKSSSGKQLNSEPKNKSNPEERPRNTSKKNRALAYQAGLKTENFHQETKFPVSEYQREYEWKKFAIGESPLLDAEKIVFDSHTNIPRFVRDKVPRQTEHQSKFVERRVAKKEYENKDENLDENLDEKREDNPSSAVKRLLQTSHNPELPFFPHGSANRVIHTEYQANFGSPKKYQYEEGMWLGAKPPHLLPDDQTTAESNEHIANWYEEVLELREKARHYKIRAIEGNYFSREYLAQLDVELERLYKEQSKKSKNERKSGPADTRSRSHDKLRSPGNEDASRRQSAKKSGRSHVKHSWESEESCENIEDGKRVYRDLNEQFVDVSLDSDTCSENDSVHDEQARKKCSSKPSFRKTNNQKHSPKHVDNSQTETSPGKTLNQKHRNETAKPGQNVRKNAPLHIESNLLNHNGPVNREDTKTNRPESSIIQKHSPSFHDEPPQAFRKDAPLLHDASPSNPDDKPENESHENYNCKPSLKKAVNQQPAFHRVVKPTRIAQGSQTLLHNISSGSDASSELSEESSTVSRECNPDKFDIKYVQAMHSNDYEAPSTSVRSNYGSESRKSYDSDSFLSQPSSASRESVARQTLAHAKQRKANFW